METYKRSEVEELIRKAYIEGFSISAEGFNAEYPFDDTHLEMETNPTINHHLDKYVKDVLYKFNLTK